MQRIVGLWHKLTQFVKTEIVNLNEKTILKNDSHFFRAKTISKFLRKNDFKMKNDFEKRL